MKISFTKKKNKQNLKKDKKKKKKRKFPTARVEPWTVNVTTERVIYCATTVSSTVKSSLTLLPIKFYRSTQFEAGGRALFMKN